MKHLSTALRLLLVMTILTGIIYPLFITGLGKALFPHQANGSLIMVDGKIKGSELVGQKFVSPRYFWSRPSAIDYNPMPSGGTNLGPTSVALKDAVQQGRLKMISTDGRSSFVNLPKDMLFASGSGVDPHISPEAARLQINRVANARGFTADQRERLAGLVDRFIEAAQWGIFGELRVNVLLLNMAVDRLN